MNPELVLPSFGLSVMMRYTVIVNDGLLRNALFFLSNRY